MNKKIIALAVAAAAFGTQASAVELYNNDGSTFSIGGHVSISAKGNSDVGSNTDLISNSPRINFNATQDLGNGFTADAKGEYSINYLNGGEESFTTRLGYIGVSHDTFGRAVGGTQWSPYYDVAGIADMPIAFANDFLYDNHGALGTGRAEGMVSYRNGIELGENMALNGGIAIQDSQTGFDTRGQVTLALDISDFMVGYAYNTGDRDVGLTSKEEAVSHVISAKYGSYGNGLYVAGVYSMNEYMHTTANYNIDKFSGPVLDDSNGIEFIAAYAFANSLNLSINYEAVESNDKAVVDGTVYSQMAFQAEYNITPSFVTFAGYQLDLGNDQNETENDMWNVGVRYYL
ncbi:porin [Vibrio superstes]|uniref:Outer membrane protein N n=1 Tax=Vibrio superstes NBRC 103154 TaxID=1219062 RepID=A0A511QPH8_9VIBR|nr:porin [Vibrio superstes]GEM78826.1 outer membrane protein N [Vibrio superstes NBRC 103154]